MALLTMFMGDYDMIAGGALKKKPRTNENAAADFSAAARRELCRLHGLYRPS
jgi:hypothetical protein